MGTSVVPGFLLVGEPDAKGFEVDATFFVAGVLIEKFLLLFGGQWRYSRPVDTCQLEPGDPLYLPLTETKYRHRFRC